MGTERNDTAHDTTQSESRWNAAKSERRKDSMREMKAHESEDEVITTAKEKDQEEMDDGGGSDAWLATGE
jgi:hypothetical protein